MANIPMSGNVVKSASDSLAKLHAGNFVTRLLLYLVLALEFVAISLFSIFGFVMLAVSTHSYDEFAIDGRNGMEFHITKPAERWPMVWQDAEDKIKLAGVDGDVTECYEWLENVNGSPAVVTASNGGRLVHYITIPHWFFLKLTAFVAILVAIPIVLIVSTAIIKRNRRQRKGFDVIIK